MDQLHLLLLLSFSMLIGSFISGYIPMAFKLSDSKSRLLALMGSGILVGTALAIIIPEGIDSIYAQPDPSILQESLSAEKNSQLIYQEPVQTWTIGMSLVAGFVLMLLIDQFSLYQASEKTPHNSQQISRQNYSLASQEDDVDISNEEGDENNIRTIEDLEITSETNHINENDVHRITMRNAEIDNHNSHLHSNNRIHSRASNTKVTPTLGLVIHASADGIALGAAATSTHRHVEMIIFLAIMLHKAPAAFSLVVFLIHRGLKHSTIRRHLLAFSLSAPLAALLTYFGLSQSGKEALRRNNTTGIAMLFSAGTFLYVATVHVLPELVHNSLLSPKELIFLVGGAFLPIILAQTI